MLKAELCIRRNYYSVNICTQCVAAFSSVSFSQEVFNFNKIWILSKKSLFRGHKIFSCKIFSYMSHLVSSIMHSELTFVYVEWGWGFVLFIFFLWLSNFSSIINWKDSFPHCNFLVSFFRTSYIVLLGFLVYWYGYTTLAVGLEK